MSTVYEILATGATAELAAKIKAGDDDTLQAAKDYANSVIETGTADGATVTYVDDQDAKTLAEAKSYAETVSATAKTEALSEAKQYTDDAFDKAISEAEDYADAAVSKANHLKYEAVEELPAAGEENVVYGVINGETGDNKRTEYIWVNGEWEVWGTDDVDLSGYLKTTDTAAAATKLATARTIQTNLASTDATSFDGTANITPGVTGILPIANGGTGASTAATALSNLGGLSLNDCTIVTVADIDAYFA